jgi:beta-phosphoglucomutase
MSSNSRLLAAVLFDLDGVIVDTAKLHYAAWKRLAESLSLQFDERRNESLKGVDRLGSLDLLLGPESDGIAAEDKQRWADLKNRWYVESLDSLSTGDVLPGADEALDQVRRAKLKVALVSASRNAGTVLGRLGMAGLFDAIVDPTCVPQGKPAPDIFLAAARQVAVEPQHCLGIEDAAAGIAGLKAASMMAIGVGDPSHLREADWVIPDLTHFRLSSYRRDS